MTGDTFDAILKLFPKIIPNAKINSSGWWSFIGPFGSSKLKFYQNKSLGILDHQYIDEESHWNIPMRIIPNGNFSEVIITLKKPKELSDLQFNQRVSKISSIVTSLKKILESNV
tara:strand:- start:145 stop:486 length:342 start_codon:yes stop_codon:yes gene_type:complete